MQAASQVPDRPRNQNRAGIMMVVNGIAARVRRLTSGEALGETASCLGENGLTCRDKLVDITGGHSNAMTHHE